MSGYFNTITLQCKTVSIPGSYALLCSASVNQGGCTAVLG